MTGRVGAPGFAVPEPVTGDVTAGKRPAAQARRLGQQHRSAAITPPGDVEHVYWEEGSAHLPGVPGGTSPATAITLPDVSAWPVLTATRSRARDRGRRSRLMTASVSPGVFVTSLVTAEDGGSHSG